MSKQKGFTPILVVIIISVLAGLGVLYFYNQKKEEAISSFEECVAAGNPVMESYPAQCNTKSGKHFVQQLSEAEKKKLMPPQLEVTSSPADYGTKVLSKYPVYEIMPSYPVINDKSISPSGNFVVEAGDIENLIVIKDNKGDILTEDLVRNNLKELGWGIKYGCQCGVHFKGWFNNSIFILGVNNALGESYEFKVDARIGKIDEQSLQRIKNY